MGKHVRSYEERIKDLEKLTDVQGQDGNWDFDPYMTGMFNGMELATSIMRGREPKYRDIQESKIMSFEMFESKSIRGKDEVPIEVSIKHLKGIPKELKDDAPKYLKQYSKARKGKITGLNLHPNLNKKIKEKDLPNGFDMGIDKDGYFIHTHRARSKSYETPDKIAIRDIKFIDSTG